MSQATVVFAWELGQGFGHVARLLPLAKALRGRGYRCVFAVCLHGMVADLLRAAGFEVRQVASSPLESAYRGQQMVSSYGDILELRGYGDAARLRAALRPWEQMLQQQRPRLLVADYAPTAQLAARGRCPVVAVGDWFSLPPHEAAVFPSFRPTAARIAEASLLSVVNAELAARGQPALTRLPQLLQAQGNFVVTLPELDCHGDARRHPAVGPLEALPAPVYRQHPTQDYFAYLGQEKAPTAKVLDFLAGSNLTGGIFLRAGAPDQVAHWRRRGLTIFTDPQDLPVRVAAARCVIHHGGLGTLQMVLALGRPQLFVPNHMEQKGNARAVGPLKIGVSMVSDGIFEAAHLGSAMDYLLGRESFASKAATLAEEIAGRDNQQGLTRVLSRIEKLCA